jgi:hypothetical protein
MPSILPNKFLHRNNGVPKSKRRGDANISNLNFVFSSYMLAGKKRTAACVFKND